MERLDDRDGGAGTEGYVFRVIIRKKQYAIKVVRTTPLYKPQDSDLSSSSSMIPGALSTTGVLS